MTLKQLVYRIKNHVESGRSTNNELLSSRQIEFDIHSLRALMARRWLERNYRFDAFSQKVSLQFETVDSSIKSIPSYIGQLSSSNTIDLYKSTTSIYSPVYTASLPMIEVRSDFTDIQLISKNAAKFQAFEQARSSSPKAFFDNLDIYVIVTKTDSINQTNKFLQTGDIPESDSQSITTLDVYGVFENPLDAGIKDTDPYPMPSDMQNEIVDILVKRYYQQDRNINDTTLDGQNNLNG